MLVFFFFKQKTAYEMRISDWSSDVCSSDLACARLLWRELNGALGKRPSVEAHHVDAVCEVEVARGFLDHEGGVPKGCLRRLRGPAQVRAPWLEAMPAFPAFGLARLFRLAPRAAKQALAKMPSRKRHALAARGRSCNGDDSGVRRPASDVVAPTAQPC